MTHLKAVNFIESTVNPNLARVRVNKKDASSKERKPQVPKEVPALKAYVDDQE
jgi:hypothetical protein